MKYLILFLLYTSQNFAQDFINYEGEKINELINSNVKNGQWKIVDIERGINISCQMSNDTFVSGINYFLAGKLIATQYKNNDLIFYKNNERIYAKLKRNADNKTKIIKKDGEEVDAETAKLFYQTAEVKAMFYGGDEALRYALLNKINKQKIKNHYGKVLVKFTVNKDGLVKDAKIISSDDEFLNEEAVKIINSLPRWQPGFQLGNFVNYTYDIPLNFGTKPK